MKITATEIQFNDGTMQTTSRESDVRLLKTQRFEETANLTGTGIIPIDTTIPQITEGSAFMTMSYTPTKIGARLEISVLAQLSSSAGSAWMTGALFKDTTTDAIASTYTLFPTGTGSTPLALKCELTVASLSPITFTLRAGTHIAATTALNGTGGVKLGNTTHSYIEVKEYLP